MTAAIDLKSTEYYTPIRLREKRDKHGARVWIVRFKCGHIKSLPIGTLRQAKQRSCGRPGCKPRSPRSGYTKRKLAHVFKNAERVSYNGEWWRPTLSAAEYLKVHRHTIDNWATNCPWLNGRGLRRRTLRDALARQVNHYAELDLNQVSDAMTASRMTIALPEFVPINDALERLGWKHATLRRRMRAANAKIKHENAKSRNGHKRRFAYVPSWFVTTCEQIDAASQMPGHVNRSDARHKRGVGSAWRATRTGAAPAYAVLMASNPANNARASEARDGATRHTPIGSEPYVPTAFQDRILKLLTGKAMKLDRLQQALVTDRKRLFYDGLKPLMDNGLVRNNRRAGGYYRPDAPPPKFAVLLGKNGQPETIETKTPTDGA
jgi:hypothetical protein